MNWWGVHSSGGIGKNKRKKVGPTNRKSSTGKHQLAKLGETYIQSDFMGIGCKKPTHT